MRELVMSLVGCAIVAATLVGVAQAQAQATARAPVARADGLHVVLDETAPASFEHAVRGQTERINALVDPVTGNARLAVDVEARARPSLYDGPTLPQLTDVDPTAAVPEPSTYVLMLGGLLLVVHLARRRAIR